MVVRLYWCHTDVDDGGTIKITAFVAFDQFNARSRTQAQAKLLARTKQLGGNQLEMW